MCVGVCMIMCVCVAKAIALLVVVIRCGGVHGVWPDGCVRVRLG